MLLYVDLKHHAKLAGMIVFPELDSIADITPTRVSRGKSSLQLVYACFGAL